MSLRRPALLAATVLVLAACGTGAEEDPTPPQESAADADDSAASEPAAPTADEGTEDDATTEDEGSGGVLADGESGVLVQFRGEQLTAGPDDATMWSCAAMADGEFIAFQFLDEAGNDVSVSYQSDGASNAALTLADGSTWNHTEGGVANASQEGDNTYRLSLQLTEVDTGESESMDARLTCG